MEEESYIEFTKVCLEFEMEKGCSMAFDMKLPNREIIEIVIEYVWRLTICSYCKSLIHHNNKCVINLNKEKTNLEEKRQWRDKEWTN